MVVVVVILQFYTAEMIIMTVFIIMPLSDLSMMGLAILSLFGLFITFLIIPYYFLDTFLLFYNKIYKSEDHS